MKWGNHRSDDRGDRVGVVESDDIRALPPGAEQAEPVGRGPR